GNLVIVPGGDPTLYSEYFEPENCTFFSDIIAKLKQLGVKEIAGNIIVADTNMPDQGPVSTWELEDIFYSYGAGYFALNYADNVFKLYTQTGTTTPFIPDAQIEIENIGESRNIIHGLNSNKYVVTGPKVFEPDSRVTMPMNNPSSALTAALATEIERNDIVFVDGFTPIITDSIPLTSYNSKPLSEILHSLMVRSDNMMAESALRLLAPDMPRDSALVREADFLNSIGVSTEYTNILDGSGLSRANSISPDFLADVLQKMTLSPVSNTFISLFPRAGMDGTMKTFLPNTNFTKRLVMKTGSMSGVRCYAGYLLNNGRPTHVVVIMVNKYFGSSSNVKRSIEQFILSTLK
ncbi:MAG: D-alanyl-D-alanine carboxypeptidase/D-alanyl-D-alanine-endopeptidase, partial [Muribaculaceae bacterium]|nr:D-alanyl-D-alanine carboxypeptidase/D-alanyl-D-alanine-endopeptidase [Muribaculaceae bacterium]